MANSSFALRPRLIDIEGLAVMIRTAKGFQVLLEGFRWVPMGGQQGGARGVAGAKHEGEVIGIPICSPGGIGDKLFGLRRLAQF